MRIIAVLHPDRHSHFGTYTRESQPVPRILKSWPCGDWGAERSPDSGSFRSVISSSLISTNKTIAESHRIGGGLPRVCLGGEGWGGELRV